MTYGIKDVIKDELTGKANHVPKNIKQERLMICMSCDKFKPISRQCGICGCFIDLKTIYADSSCPLQIPKWNEYYKP